MRGAQLVHAEDGQVAVDMLGKCEADEELRGEELIEAEARNSHTPPLPDVPDEMSKACLRWHRIRTDSRVTCAGREPATYQLAGLWALLHLL
jgi:hypothetical protein